MNFTPFIKRNSYLIIYLIFLSVVLITSKGAKLEFEWKLILDDFQTSSEYRIYGVATAFMPPFYPYFLLLCKTLFSFTNHWEMMVCVFQSSFFFYSLRELYKTFLHEKSKLGTLFSFCSIIFFPPVFFALCKISVFAFSTGVIILFFSQIYRIFFVGKKNKKEYAYLLFIVLLGLYLRYEFILFCSFLFLVLYFLKKINFHQFLIFVACMWFLYLPWSVRNYEKIGKFTYSTSLNYNFAKGNNINYNIFSFYNFPYSPQSKEILYNDILYERFENEKEIDEYLKNLNNSFLKENPELFVKLSLQKIGINFLQFFPDYGFLSKKYLSFFYSLLMSLIQILFLWCIYKNIKKRKTEFSILCIGVYFFFLLFYSVAPLPRYFLNFHPIFIVIISQTLSRNLKFEKEVSEK